MDDLSLPDLLRRIENLIRPGTVAEADYQAARVRVRLGELISGWLPWLTARAGNDRSWWAPEEGEQVLVLAPSGDPAQAVVLPALYQTAFPAPAASPALHRHDYADGAWVQYDREAHRLDVHLPGNGTLAVTAVGGVTIDAHDGNVVVIGDVIADGVSLKTHVHTGVTPGGGVSGPPVGGDA